MSAHWKVDRRSLARTEVRAGAVVGLTEASEFLLEEANRTVPIEESTLEGSGSTSVDASALQAAVSYDTPYAARQHEELGYRHDAGRRAKWLEATFKEQGRTALDRLAARIKAAL